MKKINKNPTEIDADTKNSGVGNAIEQKRDANSISIANNIELSMSSIFLALLREKSAGNASFIYELISAAKERGMSGYEIIRNLIIKDLTVEFYEGVLSRYPEPEVLMATERHFVIGGGDVATYLASLIRSREFAAGYLKQKMHPNFVRQIVYEDHQYPIQKKFSLIESARRGDKKYCLILACDSVAPYFYKLIAERAASLLGSQVIFIYKKLYYKYLLLSEECKAVDVVLSYDEFYDWVRDCAFQPSTIFLHPFDDMSENVEFVGRFPQSDLVIFGDGLKNEMNDQIGVITGRPLSGWAFCYSPIEAEVANIAPIVYNFNAIQLHAAINNFSVASGLGEMRLQRSSAKILAKTKYALVCLRYFESIHGGLDLEAYLQVIVDSIVTICQSENLCIVLKRDQRSTIETDVILIDRLSKNGIAGMKFEEYLIQCGFHQSFVDFPVEYFLPTGLLNTFQIFFTLDGSLSVILATSSRLIGKEIFIGANMSSVKSQFLAITSSHHGETTKQFQLRKESTANRSNVFLEQFQYYTTQYYRTIVNIVQNIEVLDTDHEMFFYCKIHA